MDAFEKLKEEVLGEKKKQSKTEYTSFAVLNDGLVELVYDPKEEETQFAIWRGEGVEYGDSITLTNKRRLQPFPATSGIIRNKVVLFPSKAEEYNSDGELLKEVQAFIHKYLEVSPLFEKIASHYVLFTWIYDCFNEVPYLRFLGDWGVGKSRGIKVLGVISYKPIFAGGSTTSSPIFRLLQEISGSFIIDEADFSNSEIHSDITKILNCGYERGLPVLRSEANSKGRFEIKTFNVFSPKILATREAFKDQALESRCITEQMERMSRKDIPYNLPNSFWDEALSIRNKLLLWRFKNYGKKPLNPDLADRSVEPRLNQILIPLLSIIDDPDTQKEVKGFIKEYNRQLTLDRGMELEAEVLEEIIKLIKEGEPTMKEIAQAMDERYGYNDPNYRGKRFTPKAIGNIVRKKLKLIPKRKAMDGKFIIPESEIQKINKLKEKYGIVKEFEDKTEEDFQEEAEESVSEHSEHSEHLSGHGKNT